MGADQCRPWKVALSSPTANPGDVVPEASTNVEPAPAPTKVRLSAVTATASGNVPGPIEIVSRAEATLTAWVIVLHGVEATVHGFAALAPVNVRWWVEE
jgi:hypothetical protein